MGRLNEYLITIISEGICEEGRKRAGTAAKQES
jgi:hypothetical protein